jgi:hypothetical protein
MRRLCILCFAAVALLQTGCHGRICAFFYRLTHCGDCCPSYGYGGYPVAQPCCSPSVPYAPAPVTYSAPLNYSAPPVFQGSPQPLPAPSVTPTTSDPSKK